MQNEKLKDDIAVFRARAVTFKRLKDELENKRNQVPEQWRGRYDELMQRGASVENKAKAAASTIDTGYRFARNSLGVSDEKLNGLGILPLVPIALISGSTAAMAYFANDAVTFNAKLDELERLQELGYSKEEATAMLDKRPASGSVGNIIGSLWANQAVRYGVLGIGGWVLAKKFIFPVLTKG